MAASSIVPEEDIASAAKLVTLFEEAVQVAHECEVVFSTNTDKADETGEEITIHLADMRYHIKDGIIPLVNHLFNVCHKFDPIPGVRANGVRNCMIIARKVASMLVGLANHGLSKRKSLLFRRSTFADNLKKHADRIRVLKQCLQVARQITSAGNGTSIICDIHLDKGIAINDILDVFDATRVINIGAYCGRMPNFNLLESMGWVAQGIAVSLAVSSAVSAPTSLLKSAVKPSSWNAMSGFFSVLYNQEVIAQQVLWALANFDITGVKRFGQLAENPVILASTELLAPSVALSHAITLPLTPIIVKSQSAGNKQVIVDLPSSTAEPRTKPLKTRLICTKLRQGQETWLSNVAPAKLPPTDAIVFQAHGGGFIISSSQAHEGYLRRFSQDLDAPIFCVDYSLAPESSFPVPNKEVTFAYCWMLNNMAKLGSTGKRIVVMGDSAGGCLILTMCLQLVEMGIRPPDAILLVYPYTCGSVCMSPSRLLSIMGDPVVPIPIAIRCCCAYASRGEDDARLLLGIGSPRRSSPERDDGIEKSEGRVRRSSTSGRVANAVMPLRYRSLSMSDIANPNNNNNSSAATSNNATSAVTDEDLHEFRRRRMNSKRKQRWYTGDVIFQRQRMTKTERMALGDLISLPILGNHILSPIMAPDALLRRLPPCQIFGSTGDPLLDDGTMFCQRLRKAGGTCEFTVFEGLPHGFLNLGLISRETKEAVEAVGQALKQLVDGTKFPSNNQPVVEN